MIERPTHDSPSKWNSTGILAFGPEVWAHLENVQPSPRGELEIPDVVNSLIAAGEQLKAVPLSGPWFDVGTPENLAAARRAFGG